MLNEDSIFGFCCLRCKAITRCNQRILVPGDDTPTDLTLGQRESVYCPTCRDNKTAEFQEITRLNANRVVDATGKQVIIPGMTTGPPPTQHQHQQHHHGAVASVGGAATSPVTALQPPPLVPSPMQPAQPAAAAAAAVGYATPALMGEKDFEKHVAGLADEQVRQLKQDLQLKLAVVESALAERRRCIICADKDRAVVLLPCKHMLLCDDCAKKVTTCPSCRTEIQDKIRPFA